MARQIDCPTISDAQMSQHDKYEVCININSSREFSRANANHNPRPSIGGAEDRQRALCGSERPGKPGGEDSS